MNYFIRTCESLGMKGIVAEYRFHPKRRWRIDYFFTVGLAVEIEGGLWASMNGGKSRHFYGKGAENDMIKYNAITETGIFLLRYQPKHINFDQIKIVYERLKQSNTLYI
jgi:hypothetical protein